MKHPLRKKMPLRLDLKIRFRLLLAWASQVKKSVAFAIGVLLVPALAMLVILFQPSIDGNSDPRETAVLIAAIREAQAAEVQKGSNGIYHVKQIIAEGSDKPEYVSHTTGEIVAAPARVDVIETWQHNDTALAVIESNASQHSLEAFLSLEHDGILVMHHFGASDQAPTTERAVYDTVHDLSSLYAAYRSLERPEVPVLPPTATWLTQNKETDQAVFVDATTPGIEVEYRIDLDTLLVKEEIIYVLDENGNRYEMTRIAYVQRSILPAERFDVIFDAQQYDYQPV